MLLANSTARERPRLLERLKREYGHDLDALKRQSGRRGMHMPRDVIEEFRRVNTWHNDNRYDPRLKSTEDAELLLRAAATVIRWTSRAAERTDG